MRTYALPVEFAGLNGKVNYIRQVSQTEYSSSCPQCGGTVHRNGTQPDRFRMWTNANGKNKIMGWCRRCGYCWFPKNSKPIDLQEFERWRREQLEIERQRKADAERAIALLQSQKPWIQYHEHLNQWALSLLEQRGITKEYADYWQLGLNPDFAVNGEYHSPALTIPLWQRDGSVNNIKMRVLNPKSDNDRYRSLFKMGQTYPFMAWKDDIKSDTCLIVEGEFKAMVAAEMSNQKFEVIGLPSKAPSSEILDTLASFAKATVCLDPDASKDSTLKRLVDLLPIERVSVIELPSKIDDMIVQNKLDIMDAIKYSKTWR